MTNKPKRKAGKARVEAFNTSLSNQPELDPLSKEERDAVLKGADTLGTLFGRRSLSMWLEVAKGLAILHELAPGKTDERKFTKLRADNGYASLHKSNVSRLLLIYTHKEEVNKWHDSLVDNERDRWNSPKTVCDKCSHLRQIIEANKTPRKQDLMGKVAKAVNTILDHWHDLSRDQQGFFMEQIDGLGVIESVEASVEARKQEMAELDTEEPPQPPRSKKRER
jgi:hypothetical protein